MKILYVIMLLVCIPVTVFGKKTSARTKKDAYWALELDESTKHYAFKTYKNFFAHTMKHIFDESAFKKRLKNATSLYVTPTELLSMNIGNERLERYWDKKTPEEFYPEGDRPRGQNDIKVIYDLMNTDKPVPPILLGKVKFKDNFEQIIVLDGMHRMVAAHLINKPFALVVVDLR